MESSPNLVRACLSDVGVLELSSSYQFGRVIATSELAERY